MAEASKLKLTKYLSPLNVWALSFGGIVGWGSFIIPGTTFLPIAGPLGTALGLALGAFIMLIIAMNYHFLMNRYSDVGGAFTFTKNNFGYDHGFLCAWFLTITYISLIWSNSTAIALIGRRLFNDAFQFGFHYQIFGYEVYISEIFISVAAVVIFAAICNFKNLAAKVVSAMAVIMLVIVIFVFSQSLNNVTWTTFNPLFAVNGSALYQVFSIVALAPFAFVGFEAISNSSEEFNFSLKKSFILMTSAIFSGFLFYTALAEMAVTAAANDYYNWLFYINDLPYLRGLSSLPTASAAFKALGSNGLYLLSIAIFCTLTTSLIGFCTAASRLLYSMAKDNILPQWFGKIDNGVPKNAIIFLAVVSVFIPIFGRTAISWCVDITSIGAAIAYGHTSAAAFKIAKAESIPKIEITGLIGIILSIIFALFLLLPNLLSFKDMAAESYLILVIWSILGFVVFRYIFNRDKEQLFGKSVVVWIVMLFLIFFGSIMWSRQSSNQSMEAVIHNISSFYNEEMEAEGINRTIYDRQNDALYLEKNMEIVRSSIFDHSLIQIILIFISLAIMFNLYSIMRTREKQAELDKLKAEESNKAKTTFLSNMSHDIRTPMNAIIGYILLAKKFRSTCDECTRERCPDDIPLKLQEFLDKIEVSSQHLLALINDVLEMGRIESGKLELELAETNLKEILNEVSDMFATQMEGKRIDFKVDVNVREAEVLCDRHRMNRVLLNLLSNAYKFTPEGGKVRVSLQQLESPVESGYGQYELRVKDSGIGMTANFAAKVFEAFERERTSTVSGIQGTGLGMAITKSIIDMMGGTIRVETAPGEGTEFIIEVKLKLSDKKSEEEAEPEREQTESDNFGQKRLLLVDDIEVNREIATMILMQVGFQVETASDGSEAVEKIAASAPGDYDAILMDIQMPVMNGYEATKAIRSLGNPELAKIPIIAMTANAFSEDVQAAKNAGMNGHIAKPIDVSKMMETLKKIFK